MTYVLGTLIALAVMGGLYALNRRRTRSRDYGDPVEWPCSSRVTLCWYPHVRPGIGHAMLAVYVDLCCRHLGISHVNVWPALTKGQIVYAGAMTTHGEYFPGTHHIAIGLWDPQQTWTQTQDLVRHEFTHLLLGDGAEHNDVFRAKKREVDQLCGESP
jgi:hypothetical protein